MRCSAEPATALVAAAAVAALALAAPGAALGQDAGEIEPVWEVDTIREDLAAVWVHHAGPTGSRDVRFLVYLKGAPGWLEGDASIVEGQGTPRALFRSGDVEVELALDARADEATVAGFRHDLQAWNVLLVSGLGEPDRGPSVRTLSRLPARTAPDANPAQQLYDGSVELRASIHYTR